MSRDPAVGGALPRWFLAGPPPALTIILGLLAAFAGYTAVFALNDVIDFKDDRRNMARYRVDRESFDIDSLGQRHPMAQGSLSYGAGVAWVAFWGLLSLVLAFRLRPNLLTLSPGGVPSWRPRTASCFASPTEGPAVGPHGGSRGGSPAHGRVSLRQAPAW